MDPGRLVGCGRCACVREIERLRDEFCRLLVANLHVMWLVGVDGITHHSQGVLVKVGRFGGLEEAMRCFLGAWPVGRNGWAQRRGCAGKCRLTMGQTDGLLEARAEEGALPWISAETLISAPARGLDMLKKDPLVRMGTP